MIGFGKILFLGLESAVMEIKHIGVRDALDSFDGINRLLPQLHPSGNGDKISETEFVDCLLNGNFHLFVAVDDSKKYPDSFAAMASIFFQRNLGRWIAEIHDVVVDKEYRGRGLGEKITLALIEDAKRFAKVKNAKIKLYLTSRPSRVVANKLYEKLGFELVAEARGEQGTNLYKMMITP
ncbi:MAG: hypothetical protein A3J00_03510 [Candidatus Niyogibacteria bacterium RIFCSPLOWO2_02_FULL_45_13]|nr:MAG: hypothetical protein A3J00_03510 [Candidatus Niyogibacteria bacterium RIFCSPLOWO2_02_FULL_45_13]